MAMHGRRSGYPWRTSLHVTYTPSLPDGMLDWTVKCGSCWISSSTFPCVIPRGMYICGRALYWCCGALIHWPRLALRIAMGWAVLGSAFLIVRLFYYLVGRLTKGPGETRAPFFSACSTRANSNNRVHGKTELWVWLATHA